MEDISWLWVVTTNIYCLIFLMLLHDLMNDIWIECIFGIFQQFDMHNYDNKVGLLLLRLTTCGFEMRNKVFGRFGRLEFISKFRLLVQQLLV